MINLECMPANFYKIIFGDVTIEEFLPTIVVECTYRCSNISTYGRLIVNKETAKIILANIEVNEYDETDPEYPVESIYRQARTEYPRIAEILTIFRECNKQYGYNKKIKITNMEDK